MVAIRDGRFVDGEGRSLILRGVNLGGDCKQPYRDGNRLSTPEEFHDPAAASFVGRPLREDEADEHLDRLARWGFNVARLLVTWEGLERDGPGRYDEHYYDYVERIVAKAAERGIAVFVDPHQDVWSRWTGGDGAPAWTLDAAGFDTKALHRSGAAFVHEEAGDPYPPMRWPSNYNRLACATMFTLFFAGDLFAPGLRIEGQDAREFLQGRYVGAVARLAGRLARYRNVIGVDTLNEPGDGFIGLTDLSKLQRAMSKTGPMPTPFQAMAAGSGFPQVVDTYGITLRGQSSVGSATLGEPGLSAWKPGVDCLWRREGVWDVYEGRPKLLKPGHFATVGGKPVDFVSECLRPFMRRVGAAVSAAAGRGRFMLFLEGVPGSGRPRWTREDTAATGASGSVFAGHWYDGFTLLTRRWTGFLAWDQERGVPVIGPGRVRRCFREALERVVRLGVEDMDGSPALLGEFGLPFDLDGGRAYRTGDYRKHVAALSAYHDALDAALLSSTIWNYAASNIHARGDGWNAEDLSVWCRDDFDAGRTETGDPRDAGGRAVAGFVRPYARATAGTPLSMSFDMRSGRFEYRFRPDPAIAAPTEVYVPGFQYPRGYSVRVAGGDHEMADRDGFVLVLVKAATEATECRVTIERA